MNPFSPSLDRKDSSRGYVRDNVDVVCFMYNCAKNRFTDEDVLRFSHAFISAYNIGIDNT